MIGSKKKDYMNDLCKWADKGDLKKLRKAVEKDPVLIGKFDQHGYTPLHYAAASGSTECVELLVMNGAKVNDCVRYGEITPLHAALRAKKEETALLLLKKGANPELQYQTESAFKFAAAMGKRFELEFRDIARKNQTHAVPKAQAPAPPTSTLSQAPRQPDVSMGSIPAQPAAQPVAANTPVIVKQQQPALPVDMKPISPADAALQAMTMLGMTNAADTPTDQSSKEVEAMHYNKVSSSQQLQTRISERKSVLQRRLKKFDAIRHALEMVEDVTDFNTPEVYNAVASLGFSTESLPKEAPVSAPKPLSVKVKRGPIVKKTPPSTPTGAPTSPTAAAAPASPKAVRPPPVVVPTKLASPEEAAEAIIQHFKSWFDPSIGHVDLPAWFPVVAAPQSAAPAAQSNTRQIDLNAAIHGTVTTPTQPQSSTTLVALTDLMLQWTRHICGFAIISKECDFKTLREKVVRDYVEDFRKYHSDLDAQVDMQQDLLGDSYKDTKTNIVALRDRVINLLDQYFTVSLRHEDPAVLLYAYMQIIGATYFTFQSMFSCDSLSVVASIKEFVAAVLNLGKEESSDSLAAEMCMKLNGIVGSLAFRANSAEVAKQLSLHVATVSLTTRALLTDFKQGNPRKNEYNVSIGSHLSKMKELLRNAARSHRGDQLSVKEETHVFEMACNYVGQAIAFYKTVLTTDEGKEVIEAIEKLIPLIRKFAELAIHSREVTLNSWIDVLQSALDLTEGVCHFCDDTVYSFDDPDGVFDTAILICKQYLIQIVLSITSLAAENPVIPRHHISLSLRALSIHLISILDIFYFSS